MKKSILLYSLLLIASQSAHAICPKSDVSLCTMVRDSDWVVFGSVAAKQSVSDEDDPQGVAGWLYHIMVKTSYLGSAPNNMVIYSENTTSRVMLDSGKSYFVFATKNFEGMPEIANLCTPYTELTYSKDFEDKILSCLQDKK